VARPSGGKIEESLYNETNKDYFQNAINSINHGDNISKSIQVGRTKRKHLSERTKLSPYYKSTSKGKTNY
jgi:hypothetical protein